MGHCGHVAQAHGSHEALQLIVAGVRLQQQRGVVVDGVLVVPEVGAIGGAHFAQLAASAGHQFGQPKAAADLNQLAARDRHVAPQRQRVQHQHHRGGIVVHHGGVFGAGQEPQPVRDDALPIPALAAFEVVFERHGARRGGQRATGDAGTDGAAAEIAVQ